MQIVVDGGAVAGHFGECFGEFEAVGNEDIAAELTLCSSGASNACENPLCLFSRAMRDTGNIGYLLARHVEDDAARVDAHHAIGDAFQIARDVARKQHAAIAGRGIIAQLIEQLVASGSSPAVASSRMSKSASCESAQASCSFMPMPRESDFTFFFGSSSNRSISASKHVLSQVGKAGAMHVPTWDTVISEG